jgi:hypothetical protein
MNTPPLALSDGQLECVMNIAKTLRRFQRSDFLQAVADILRDQEIGDGAVYLACIKARRKIETQHCTKHDPPPCIDGTMPMASAK